MPAVLTSRRKLLPSRPYHGYDSRVCPNSRARSRVGLIQTRSGGYSDELGSCAANRRRCNNGWVTVKFRRDGIEQTPTLPPDQIEPAVKKKSPPSAKPAPKSDAKPDVKPRIWSNKSGKFKITAKFVELKDGSVTLENANGETVTVALDKLSEADQNAARELAEELEDNPFGE